MVPGRSGPELGAMLFQLEAFVHKHPELGCGYLQHEPLLFEEDKSLLPVASYPELAPYKNLEPSRLKITGDGRWPLQQFLDGPLWLPYQEPRFLLHGKEIDAASMPNFKFESREANLELCKLWDSKGLLGLHRGPLVPGHFSRVFNAHKSKEVDRQIGDRRIPNSRERSIDGPSAFLPPGFLLTNLRVKSFEEELRASITDRRDFYHQACVTQQRSKTNMLPFSYTPEELRGLKALEAAEITERKGKRPKVRGVDLGDGFGGPQFEEEQQTHWFPSFNSLFQGDHLGVEFALQAHEGLLRTHELLSPTHRILGRSPFPLGGKYEGLIIDDFFAIGVEKIGGDPLSSFAARALATARAAYEEHRLPGSIEKDVEAANNQSCRGRD